MDAPVHRGADSTGFALYGPSLESGFVVRAVGFDRSRLGRDLDNLITILRDFGSDIVEDPTYDDACSRHVSVRFVVRDIDDVASSSEAADEIRDRIEIQSVGRSLEIVKDTGTAEDVARKHGVREFLGTHGPGARTARD